MQKLSIRKISMLGLVLMAASAVTAAVIPSKSDKNMDKFANGSLTNESGPGAGVSSVTCAADTVGDGEAITAACNHSTGEGAGTESSENTGQDSASQSSLGGLPDGAGGGNTSDNS